MPTQPPYLADVEISPEWENGLPKALWLPGFDLEPRPH